MKLTATRLVAARGGEVIAGPLDFTLAAGEAMVVTGENGAGKSTLLRTLAGLLPPGAGAVTIEGAPAADGEAARNVSDVAHYLGHRTAMKPNVSVGANLSFWRDVLGFPGLGPDEALAAVDLPSVARLPQAYLSAGQQRRAAIARLLVSKRPVWILDEPTSALDTASQALFARLLEAHAAGGGILIAATHQSLGVSARTLRLEPRRAAVPGRPSGPSADDLAAAEGWL